VRMMEPTAAQATDAEAATLRVGVDTREVAPPPRCRRPHKCAGPDAYESRTKCDGEDQERIEDGTGMPANN
jgi:hypothetical protein